MSELLQRAEVGFFFFQEYQHLQHAAHFKLAVFFSVFLFYCAIAHVEFVVLHPHLNNPPPPPPPPHPALLLSRASPRRPCCHVVLTPDGPFHYCLCIVMLMSCYLCRGQICEGQWGHRRAFNLCIHNCF